MLFRKIKSFFSDAHSSANFLIFLNLKNFAKNWIWVEKRHFWEILSFCNNSAANLPPLTILERIMFFFLKKPNFFSPKNSKFLKFLQILLSQSHSTASLLYLSDKEFKFRIGLNQSATKCKKNVRAECMIFLPFYKNGRQIIIRVAS